MSKKLFTRLQPSIYPTHTQQIVDSIINDILDCSHIQIRCKQLQEAGIHILTEEFMNKQICTVGQAFARNPYQPLLSQDQALTNCIYESNRPLSAKINTISKTKTQGQRSSRKSLYRYSHRSSMRSTKSIGLGATQKHRKGRFDRENKDKYFLLPVENENDTTAEQQYINLLRAKKAKESVYQRQKEKFFKTMAEDQERYSKMNKKFVQLMGNKSYYYNKNGETVQTVASQMQSSKLLKKSAINRVPSKAQNSKRLQVQQGKAEIIVVGYRQKQNPFKKMGESFIMDNTKKLLFYKSDNCKYKILTKNQI